MIWEKKGRVRWCRIDTKGLDELENWVLNRRALWERRLDALETHLAQDEEV
jgi:hypothetical protein